MTVALDFVNEALAAERYRQEAADFAAEARAVRAAGGDAWPLERTRMDLISLAACIERSLRGIVYLPAVDPATYYSQISGLRQ